MKKKYDDGGPVASASPPPSSSPKFAGRVSAGKDPGPQTDSDNKITGRIKASEFRKGGVVTKKKR